jgi:hypothetical protein
MAARRLVLKLAIESERLSLCRSQRPCPPGTSQRDAGGREDGTHPGSRVAGRIRSCAAAPAGSGRGQRKVANAIVRRKAAGG